ncbi:conserved hypothetical protein [Helicobacter acinonychis str. Sheeba]|uniref:Beta-lactamase n=2 Tax=Helicobacter acinonychis TaxID=212 RepID=Q17X71_HELAH|nr:conserved hypothetical protein [Helicobacter acinonychis str. Sheeba]
MLGNFKKAIFRVLCLGCAVMGGGLMASQTPKELFDWGVESNKARNFTQAKKYFEKACNLNYAEGCFGLGILYIHKDFGEKNYKKALALMTKGCELNYAVGCSFLGTLYQNGNGVKKDLKKAFASYTKACGLKEGYGCLRLGEMQRSGEGVVKNLKQAMKTLKKGCELKNEMACMGYGVVELEIRQERCKLGDEVACYTLEPLLDSMDSK